jgi:uncharacterized membrane protein
VLKDPVEKQASSGKLPEEKNIKPGNQRVINRKLSFGKIYDLLLLVSLALLLPVLVILPVPLIRLPLGLVVVLLAPGYALAEAVFAHKDDLDGVARLGLSFGLSVAILPILALVLSYLPWGIRLWPMTISLALWIFFVCGVAAFRRWQFTSTDDSAAPPVPHPLVWWRGQNKITKGGYVLGMLGFLIIGTYGAYVFLSPNPADRLTELYVLGAEGRAESYPREVAPGQEMQVTVGIVNRQGVTGRYLIEARSKGVLLANLGPVILKDGEKWEQLLRYWLTDIGNEQKIDISLFYNDGPAPYRQLRLWVNVRESAGS